MRNAVRSIAVAVIAFLVLAVSTYTAATYFWKGGIDLYSWRKTDYVIPGVPYFGVFHHKGEKAGVSGDTASAVASILEYWNLGHNNLADITRYLNGGGSRLIGFDRIKDLVDMKGGYEVKEVHLENIEDIKKYVNSGSRTPLFTFFPVAPDQTDALNYHSSIVIIGIKDSERKVVLHSYWFGNNFEISFDDFEKMWGLMREGERNNYLVIRPTDLRGGLKEISKRIIDEYPARTSIMTGQYNMIKNCAYTRGSYLLGLDDMTIRFGSLVENDSKFSDLPSFFKVNLYYEIADAYRRKKDNQNALDYANKAIYFNHDLDKSVGEWPGYNMSIANPETVGIDSNPYKILGDVQFQMGELAKAYDSYKRAIEISPSNQNAQAALKFLIKMGESGSDNQGS